MTDRAPITPEGWEPICGPVPSVPTITLRDDRRRLMEGCVTVGNRVRAAWQQYNYFLGTGTIVGFEREKGIFPLARKNRWWRSGRVWGRVASRSCRPRTAPSGVAVERTGLFAAPAV